MSQITYEKLNHFCSSIQASLVACGLDTTRILNAVNAEMGSHPHIGNSEPKPGSSRFIAKGHEVESKVALGSATFRGARNVVSSFKVFHDGIERLEKAHGQFELGAWPVAYSDWLSKFKLVPDESASTEPASNGSHKRNGSMKVKPVTAPQ